MANKVNTKHVLLIGCGSLVGLTALCCVGSAIFGQTDTAQRLAEEQRQRDAAQVAAQQAQAEAAAAQARQRTAEAEAAAAQAQAAAATAQAQAGAEAAAAPQVEEPPSPEAPDVPEEVAMTPRDAEIQRAERERLAVLIEPECRDEGPNDVAPHHCTRNIHDGTVLKAVNWWGERAAPSRVMVAVTFGERARADPQRANMMMTIEAIGVAMRLGTETPSSATRSIDRPGTTRTARFRHNGFRFVLEVKRLRRDSGAFLYTVDVTDTRRRR
jgi:chemotaxis protein histidine kinase CheA